MTVAPEAKCTGSLEDLAGTEGAVRPASASYEQDELTGK